MHNLSRTVAGGLLAIALMAISCTPAAATTTRPSEDGEALVAEFFGELTGADDAVVDDAVSAFQALSPTEQADVISTLESESPMDIFLIGEAVVTESRTPTRTAGAVTLAATTYDVLSTYSYPVKSLGINFGSFNLRYRYQTGSNRVLKDYSCTASRTGITGYWNYTWSTEKWVSGGQGTCLAQFRGTLSFNGSNISQSKEMGMIVNGAGIKSKWLTAL